MQISENVNLAPYTTFYIGGPSRYLIFAQDNDEVMNAIQFAREKQLPYLIFGGGSNLLISDAGFDGVAIRIESVGMDLIEENTTELKLKVASGEVWDDVVRFAVEENWWGIENLSHIPGFTGAISVQNVGAYGQEASQVVDSVEVYDIENKQVKNLFANELNFDYRSSIFNSTHKNKYVILSTTFKLSKIPQPNLTYGDLTKEFPGHELKPPAILEIRNAIIKIRNKKFPFPDVSSKGNSGSFFRGPLLSDSEFENFKQNIISNFPYIENKLNSMSDRLKVPQGYKTPAALLIELCELKNKTVGGAKINTEQPAIILNFTGDASSSEVLALYKLVKDEVAQKTGVILGIEPELIGFTSQQLGML